MPKIRTWKVLGWFEGWETCDKVEKEGITLTCECGRDAWVPTRGSAGCLIIATRWMMIFTDPAGASLRKGFMPHEIVCRKCGRVYGAGDGVARRVRWEVPDVR